MSFSESGSIIFDLEIGIGNSFFGAVAVVLSLPSCFGLAEVDDADADDNDNDADDYDNDDNNVADDNDNDAQFSF